VVAFAVIRQPVALRDIAGGVMVMAGVLLAALGHPPGGRTRRDLAVGIAAGALGMILVALGVAFVDDLLATETVLPVTTYRLLFGTLALLPLALARPALRQEVRRLTVPGPLWRHSLPGAVTGGALAMWAWLAGFAAVDVARAAVLNQLSTIWITVLAVALLGERLTGRRLASLVLGFGGALLVMTG
jgi:drug/metabolite transporter (DMT)-like permease